MRKAFADFLENEGICVYGEVSAENLKVIQPHLMPEGVKSAMVWLIPYYTGRHENRNVSLYAVSRDYHFYARDLNARLVTLGKSLYPNDEFYGFCDSSPINEVAVAISAGLGMLGKNRLLINEKLGSYVFIGCMLATLGAECPKNEPLKKCPECGACVRACGFLSGKDDTCASELNQRKQLTDEETALVKSRKVRWGCDICQEACPFNKNLATTPIRFFHEDIIEVVTPEIIQNMSKDEFRRRAYAWRGKKTILRNITE